MICVQEHHIACSDLLWVWQDRFQELGWTFMGSLATRTVGKTGKEGSRAGVRALLKRHLSDHGFEDISARFVKFKINLGV